MKRFVRFVGKLPFSGKIAIHELFFNLYLSTTLIERIKNYLFLILLLIIYIICHGLQARMGVCLMYFNCPIWAKTIGVLYAIANISVVITQIYLAIRATIYCLKSKYPKRKRISPKFPDKEANKAVLFTLTCQIVFVTVYLIFILNEAGCL